MSDLRTDWRFNRVATATDLAACLPPDQTLDVSASTEQTLWVCDAFNGLIWQSGCVLVRGEAGDLQLWQDLDQPLATSAAASTVRFWWQLPRGALAEKLKKLLGNSAFMPKFSLRLTSSLLNILNSDQKIVTRIRLFRLDPLAGPALWLATFLPLRGFEADYQRSIAGLAALAGETVPDLTLRQLLIEGGLQIEIPVSKPEFQLQPLEPSEPAILRMAQVLLQTARRYEPGLVADIDSEFVHQYRVNIRKTRSLLSLFKKALSPRRYQQLRADLKVLGSRTNLLRDLDVFLLEKENYHQLLPAQLRPGLGQLFSRIKRRRARVLKRVTAALRHPDYGLAMEQVTGELEREPEFATSQAATPLKLLVCSRGLRLYRKICREGQAITDETPATAIHALRISAKKLRYLLELFSELFPREKLRHLLSDLKKLQNNLGSFNDFSVQAEFLRELERGRTSVAQTASLNGLSAVLYHQQRQERGQLVENIAVFSSTAVSAQFLELLTMDSDKDAAP